MNITTAAQIRKMELELYLILRKGSQSLQLLQANKGFSECVATCAQMLLLRSNKGFRVCVATCVQMLRLQATKGFRVCVATCAQMAGRSGSVGSNLSAYQPRADFCEPCAG